LSREFEIINEDPEIRNRELIINEDQEKLNESLQIEDI
jgi:hypothetical protein